jgi:hypothetical protein
MELDGLSSNTSQLSITAKEALTYISTHVRSHGASLKVQTSKGNYLSSLSVRAEEVDFSIGASGRGDVDRNMDDLILKAAIWQEEHWVDRSGMLKSVETPILVADPVKVVLLSLDRNCGFLCYISQFLSLTSTFSTSESSFATTSCRE